MNTLKAYFLESQLILNDFMANENNFRNIESAAILISDAIKNGGKIISCGNGGSHCDAMHFAEELTGRFRGDRRSLPAIAISDPSFISCAANDYGFEYIFSRFIEGLGNEKDVLLAISTSGNSLNIINAVNAARSKGMKVIVLSGKDGGKLAGNCDVEVRAPQSEFADHIQEIHIKVIHAIIMKVEMLLELA